MKLNANQLLGISAQILSGMLVNNPHPASLGRVLDDAIYAAKALAERIPVDSVLPSDEEIRELCEGIIPEEGMATLLLNTEIRSKLGLDQYTAYSIIQKAHQLKIIDAHYEGRCKNRTVWTLVPACNAGKGNETEVEDQSPDPF